MRTAIIVLVMLATFVASSTAQVETHRRGDENPVATIAKATLWGALAGGVLGGAVALVADDDEWEIIKWGIVGGTFFGFGFGVYHVLTRPEPTGALLEIDDDGRLALGVPTMEVRWQRVGWREQGAKKPSGNFTLLSYRF
jgi:hypothetical protein